MSDSSGQVPSGGLQQPPPGYGPPTMPPAKKKGRGCLIAGSIVGALTLCCICSGTFLFLNMGKPKDLGVTYSEADYWNAMSKAGVQVVDASGPQAPLLPADEEIVAVAPPASVAAPPVKKGSVRVAKTKKPASEDWVATGTRYSGTRKIDVVFTAAETSALMNYSHKAGWPLKNVQVTFPGGDAVQMSGVVVFNGADYPFFVSGSAAVGGNRLSGAISGAEVLGVPVPAQYYPPATEYALSLINGRLARLAGLDITTAEVVDGGLHIVGTVPAQVERSRR